MVDQPFSGKVRFLIDDDAPVHLGQFGQPLRRELGVIESESPAHDPIDLGSASNEDQGTRALGHDELGGGPQCGAGSKAAKQFEGGCGLRRHRSAG